MAQGEKKKVVVEESYKTRKAREKLRKHLANCESKMTPQALEKKTVEIHRWISRHASQRIVLRTKTISLFDENENAMDASQKISKLAEQVQSWKM
jgi:hypothetical protein